MALTVWATLAIAATAAAQEPAHHATYTTWMQALEAAPAATLASWGEKADARLAWLLDYLAADRPDEEFQRWLAADEERQSRILYDPLRALPGIDWPARLPAALRCVERAKQNGRFDSATAQLERLLSAFDAGSPQRGELLLQLAECHRRAYRWDRAGDALAAAAETSTARVDTHVAWIVQRAALALARGLPDLAQRDVERAEALAADAEQAAQALFVRLRLEHALRRPARAVELLQRFLARSDVVAERETPAWQPRLAQLQVRAALAVLIDPADATSHDAQAERWLDAAIALPTTPADERVLARIVLATHRLDRGQLAAVPGLLTDAAKDIPARDGSDLDERRLALATLTVRHGRLARQDLASRQRDIGRLRENWHRLVGRWDEQAISRVGEGPLFFGDCRRAFVELLRAELESAPTAKAAAEAILEEVLRATTPGSLGKQLGALLPSLAELRSALCPAGAGFLVYVPGHDASVVVACDATDLAVEILPFGALRLDDERRALLLDFERARQEGDATALQATASRLSEWLLPGPLAARVATWRRIGIAGGESLGYLPFELLPLGSARLGASHAVHYLPSLAVAVRLARRHAAAATGPSSPPHVRLVACPDARAAIDSLEAPTPLPFTATDRERLAEACQGTHFEALVGSAATAAAAWGCPTGTTFLHVLAHGMRDEARDDPQGILFGDGRTAWGDSLENGTLPHEVMLTVCRAGRGRLRRGGDGRQLLSAAAMLAGADAVVLPVLEVGYRSSLAFAADVHRALWQDGLDLAESLRIARAAAEDRGHAGLDAFAFHLVGIAPPPHPRLRVSAPHAWGVWGWLAGAIAAAAAVAVVRQRRT